MSVYAVVGGLLSATGWAADLPRLTDWFNLQISTQPNTALCVTAAGLGLLALALGRRPMAAVMGLAVLLIAGATGLQHVFKADFGIDTFLMFDRTWGRKGVAFPGRMGTPGAISWSLIGIAILLSARGGRASVRWVPTIALLTAAISSLSLIGYLYGASQLYTVPSVTAIALQTATFIFAISIGLVATVEDSTIMRLVRDDGPAGTLIRRFLPMVIGVPLLLGLLRLAGQERGWYDAEFGTALRSLTEIVLFLVILFTTGNAIRRGLAAKERQLQHVTDNAAVMVAQCGKDFRYVFVNKGFAEFVGRPVEQIVGHTIAEVIGADAFARLRPHIDRVLAGETVQFETELPTAGGQLRYMRGQYVPDYNRDGTIAGYIAAITDMTDRKRIEDALLTADRRKDEFLATLAHELRNPLAPIRSAVTLMSMQDSLSPEQASGRAIIERQVTQMSRLLDDLLDVSRISRDRLELRREGLELCGLIRNTIEACRPMFDEFKHQLSVQLPSKPVYLYADPVRLGQVFGNLLNNACKYTNPGGRIEIRLEEVKGKAIFHLRDNGIGIPKDKLDSVFDMFSQVDRSLEKAHAGLGIGLHLVKRMVELHGGTVEAQSQGEGTGAHFIVTLPDVVHSEASASATTAPARPEARVAAPRRVLVVDDNTDAATSLATLLEHVGHETQVAHDGMEALELCKAYEPDVILLDIGLPKLNGYETCRRIRSSTGPVQPMIVALTGWGGDQDREQSKEAGFDAHLVKPVDYHQLLGMLTESQPVRR